MTITAKALPNAKVTITKIENDYIIKIIHNEKKFETRIDSRKYFCKFIKIPQVKNIIEGTIIDTNLKCEIEYNIFEKPNYNNDDTDDDEFKMPECKDMLFIKLKMTKIYNLEYMYDEKYVVFVNQDNH